MIWKVLYQRENSFKAHGDFIMCCNIHSTLMLQGEFVKQTVKDLLHLEMYSVTVCSHLLHLDVCTETVHAHTCCIWMCVHRQCMLMLAACDCVYTDIACSCCCIWMCVQRHGMPTLTASGSVYTDTACSHMLHLDVWTDLFCRQILTLRCLI